MAKETRQFGKGAEFFRSSPGITISMRDGMPVSVRPTVQQFNQEPERFDAAKAAFPTSIDVSNAKKIVVDGIPVFVAPAPDPEPSVADIIRTLVQSEGNKLVFVHYGADGKPQTTDVIALPNRDEPTTFADHLKTWLSFTEIDNDIQTDNVIQKRGEVTK